MSALTAVEVRVFECPSCGQTINTSMAQCPYCSAAVDPVAAVVAAELTSKVSQACSDASYVRIVAGTIVVFFLLFLVPFLGIVGLAGYYVLLVLVPILVGRWLLKYATLRTKDGDFVRAKRNVLIALAVWVAFLLFTSIRVAVGWR
ncbi:MAG TPA: hypothetical protein VK819_08115 [Acidobacteriaceae bacterium]|jgi:hypothetical protein|nr:hypothetical protein [Acidobacteriaceae bacterium]